MTFFQRPVLILLVLGPGLLPGCQASSISSGPSGATTPVLPGGIRRTLLERQPAANLPGWETRLYLVEYAPGASAPPHVHPENGVGLVLTGRFESAFGDEPVTEVNAGRAFVERAGLPHRIFRNPSSRETLRFVVAFTLRSSDEPSRRIDVSP